MMQEAMIICPRGNDVATANATSALIDKFGGCTVGEAQGFWKDAAGKLVAEPVETLTSAFTSTWGSAEVLRGIAERYGAEAQQIVVYVRHASGAVEFIPTAHLWEAAREAA